jgi:hypothetical protein
MSLALNFYRDQLDESGATSSGLPPARRILYLPGDPWWETGSDTVIAWSSRQMGAKFMRAMVLPVEWQGRVTGEWLSGAPPVRRPGSWKLYVDQVVTV